MVILKVTPTGIYDGNTLFSKWEDVSDAFKQLKGSDSILLEPFDSFSAEKFPEENTTLQNIIDKSGGSIDWQFPPKP